MRTRPPWSVPQDGNPFEHTFDLKTVAMAYVGLDGRWLHVNRRLCNIVGYSRDELLVRTFQDITRPKDLEKDLEEFRRTLSGEIARYEIDKGYMRADGQPIWVKLNAALVRTPEGEPDYFVTVVHDIGAPEQTDEERRHRACTVIVIDDTELNRVLTSMMLEGVCNVLTHEGGAAALQLLADQAPELVLLDIAMPGLDGYAVLARIRAHPTLHRTRVIAFTANGTIDDKRSYLDAGFDGFLAKPILDLEVFQDAVRAELGSALRH